MNRLLVSGKHASPFWGGSTNPNGTKKKVARYDTKEKKSARQKEIAQKRAASKKDVRQRFMRRRTELEKLKLWRGPRKFEGWLLQLGERALDNINDVDELQVCAAPLVIGV